MRYVTEAPVESSRQLAGLGHLRQPHACLIKARIAASTLPVCNFCDTVSEPLAYHLHKMWYDADEMVKSVRAADCCMRAGIAHLMPVFAHLCLQVLSLQGLYLRCLLLYNLLCRCELSLG